MVMFDRSYLRATMERFSWHHVALVLVALLVLYRRLTIETPIFVFISEPKFRPLHPDESVTFPQLSPLDYSRLIDIEDFKFEINSLPCSNTSFGLLLVVIVASNPRNFDKRRIIRETWGQSTEATRLVFLVGTVADAEISQQVSEESSLHGDLVRGNFEDAYRNMTYKHVMGLKWVTYHCPTARYILKMDDDTVVNVAELGRFLTHEIGPWGAKDLITCQLLQKTKVQRSNLSKWKVSPAEYPHDDYPDYCAGWAVLYSADVVRRLYTQAQLAPYFWVDDAHITGVLAEKAGIPRTPLGRLQLSNAKLLLLMLFGYTADYGVFLFGPADMSAMLMSKLWGLIPGTVK